MGKIKNQIIEDSYAKKHSADQELSILVGVDSFAYIIVNGARQPQLIREYALSDTTLISKTVAQIQQIIQEDKPLNLPYKRIRIAYSGNISTLIPQRLYHPDEKEQYLAQVTALDEAFDFRADHMLPIDAQNVYAIEEELATFMSLSYPGTMLLHLNSVIYEGIATLTKNKTEKSIFVNVRGRNLNIFYFDKDQLVFMNSFQFQSSKDFVYYVMLIIDQFSLDSQKLPIYLSGEIVEESEIYNLLFRYVKHLHFISNDQLSNLGSNLASSQAYRYFDLITFSRMA